MENIMKIDLSSETKDLNIYTGQTEPVYYKKGITVNGSIASALEFLRKKIIDSDVIQNSVLEFCYDKLEINLVYDARERNPDVIKGKVRQHPDLLKFEINKCKQYSTFELADIIKMNRHYFENVDYAMKLVKELRGFEGKVRSDVEAKTDGRGNNKALINQVVESNIPESFILNLPVFVGQETIRLEVEVSITADFSCTLISPDLKKLIDLEAKTILDDQLKQIKELHPELKVFEV